MARSMFDINDFDDPDVWDLICEGRTKGVFQLESQLGRSWAKRVKPRNISELAALLLKAAFIGLHFKSSPLLSAFVLTTSIILELVLNVKVGELLFKVCNEANNGNISGLPFSTIEITHCTPFAKNFDIAFGYASVSPA